MDRLTLSQIEDELGSEEVDQLCFLCRDVVNKRHLDKIKNPAELFEKLEEKGLLGNFHFLLELLRTIHRKDLVQKLQGTGTPAMETDSIPRLDDFRVMLFNIYFDMTSENLDRMKFLLGDKLGKRALEKSSTVLDVFIEMEKTEFISRDNVAALHDILSNFDQQLAAVVGEYIQKHQRPQLTVPSQPSADRQAADNPLPPLSLPQTSMSYDATPEPPSPSDDEYYSLTRIPRGLCVIFNNVKFKAQPLRSGSDLDKECLTQVFERFGFKVLTHDNLTASEMEAKLEDLGRRDFTNDDALVVCVLSHGENGSVFGVDGNPIPLRSLTQPFTTGRAHTLIRKPKIFFIQACQGQNNQNAHTPLAESTSTQDYQADGGTVINLVPSDADFLMGMSTVPGCLSFRNTSKGTIYIQELCKQLEDAAKSSNMDDILTVLTRVNREVSKGKYLNQKQMPEPKYTLTKKLVFRFV